MSLLACFADINVSQGSVATYAKCGRTFSMRLIANLPRKLAAKKFGKSVTISQNYGHESVCCPPCIYMAVSRLAVVVPYSELICW